MEKINTLFISDVHLGNKKSNPNKLLETFEKYSFNKLIIIGDFIDLTSLGISDISLSSSYPNLVGTFIDDVKIRSLNGAGVGTGNELASSISKTYVDMDAGGKHLCFAWPNKFGLPKFTIGGLTNTAFTRVKANFTFVNEVGFSGTKYDVWVSNTAYNSKTTVIINN